ncbi:hypothetical protein ABIA38_005599 [Embleya sp. AB8]
MVWAHDTGFVFRAVAADCAYGNQAYTPVDTTRALPWGGPDRPGERTAVTRTFRDGPTEE